MIGIILAGGKGTRLNCKTQNKTTLDIGGKPLIQFGVDLFEGLTKKTIIVVGAFASSVMDVVQSGQVIYAHQTKRLGTGHALKVAVREVKKQKLDSQNILVGYGDHMANYKKQSISKFIDHHKNSNASITLIVCENDNPNDLAWGRVIKDNKGKVIKIVEQKDATKIEKQAKLLNAGFYCFKYDFLAKYIDKLTKSKITNEYYLTELISLAIKNRLKVEVFQVPFNEVGSGINTLDQYIKIQKSLETTSISNNIFKKLWQTFPKLQLMRV